MRFEPDTRLENAGYYLGFLFSWILATAIFTTIFTWIHKTMQLWVANFVYFFFVILLILLISLGVKRLLR